MPTPPQPWQSLSMDRFYFSRTRDPDGEGEVDTLYVVTDLHSNY